MANARLRGRVKFFLSARKVLFLAPMKNVGTLTVNPGGTVKLDTEVRALGRSLIRGVSLGPNSQYTVLILGAQYANSRGTFEPEQPPLTPLTAQLVITITNDPPDTPTPIQVDVDETEENPADEPGDDPGLANDGVLFNGS